MWNNKCLRMISMLVIGMSTLVGLVGCKTHGDLTTHDHLTFLTEEQKEAIPKNPMPMGSSTEVVYGPDGANPHRLAVAGLRQNTMRESATNLEQVQTIRTGVNVVTDVAHAGSGIADWRRVLFQGNEHRYRYDVNNRISGDVGGGGGGLSPEALGLLGTIADNTEFTAVATQSTNFQVGSGFQNLMQYLETNFPQNP